MVLSLILQLNYSISPLPLLAAVTNSLVNSLYCPLHRTAVDPTSLENRQRSLSWTLDAKSLFSLTANVEGIISLFLGPVLP